MAWGGGVILVSFLVSFHFLSRVAVIIAPFVIDLDYGPYKCAPYIIIAFVGLVSSIFIILYGPETHNKPLLNTVKDFYDFVADPDLMTVDYIQENLQHT